MSTIQVTEIIQKFKQLTPADRERVLEQLDAIREAEFEHELEAARASAKADGIDDDAIDRAVEKVRYGR